MKFEKLSKADVRRFLLGLSLVAYVSAILCAIYPRVPDGTGRWRQFHLFLYQSFGLYGQAAWWAVIGTVLLVSYFSHRR